MSIERLENCLRISEEGCAINEFNADHAIKRWYENKVRRIANAKPPKYPNKRQRVEGPSSNKVIDIAKYTLSDFEESGSSDEGYFQTHAFHFYVGFICAVLIFVYNLHFSIVDIMY